MTENSRLRVANSGPRAFAPDFATNAAIGRVLTCVANPDPTKPLDVDWQAAGAAAFTNLTNVLYVNPGTPVPVPAQIGNIEQPFATLAAGIARAIALAAPTVIYLTDAIYAAEIIPAMPAAQLAISSMDVGAHSLTSFPPVLPTLPAGCTDLAIAGCAYGDTTADQLLLVACSAGGNITTALLYSYDSILGATAANTAVIQGGTLLGAITSGGGIQARDAVIQSDILLPNAVGAVDCIFTNCSWRNAAPVNIGNALAGTSVLKMVNCDFRQGLKVTLLSAGGGTLNIDPASYASLLASGTLAADIQLVLTMGSAPHPAGVLPSGTNIAAGTAATVDITVPGLPLDVAFAISTDRALDAGLAIGGRYRSAADTMTVQVVNATAGGIITADNITFRAAVL